MAPKCAHPPPAAGTRHRLIGSGFGSANISDSDIDIIYDKTTGEVIGKQLTPQAKVRLNEKRNSWKKFKHFLKSNLSRISNYRIRKHSKRGKDRSSLDAFPSKSFTFRGKRRDTPVFLDDAQKAFNEYNDLQREIGDSDKKIRELEKDARISQSPYQMLDISNLIVASRSRKEELVKRLGRLLERPLPVSTNPTSLSQI